MTRRLSTKTRVENGARWLDENFPDWEDRINIETLGLADSARCICGQVFADKANKRTGEHGYGYANRTLFSEANSWITAIVGLEPISARSRSEAKQDRADAVSTALGFDIDFESYNGDTDPYGTLQRAWVRLLKSRAKARK